MKSFNLISIFFILILVSSSSYLIYFSTISKSIPEKKEVVSFVNKSNVSHISNIKTFIVNGNSMEPLIKNGEEIKVDFDYYKKNKIKVNDIIFYNSSAYKNNLIKIVKVIDTDIVEIQNKTFIVNGVVLSNSVNKSYSFSSKEIKMLSLYINNHHIPKNSVFIFGDNVGNSLDSRRFGAVDKSQIVGKVIFNYK